eukprot:1181370-Prorocentrum_minimum.AAC.2
MARCAGAERTYYTYKFKRQGDLAIGYLCAAAKGGKVFVLLAGGGKTIEGNDDAIQELKAVTETFRLRGFISSSQLFAAKLISSLVLPKSSVRSPVQQEAITCNPSSVAVITMQLPEMFQKSEQCALERIQQHPPPAARPATL